MLIKMIVKNIVIYLIYILQIRTRVQKEYRMSRHGSTVSRHRKGNYSLDIKRILKTNKINSPQQKTHEIRESQNNKKRQKILYYTSSIKSSGKHLTIKPKKRLSLRKTFNSSNSVGIQNIFIQDQIITINRLIQSNLFLQSLTIIKQLLIHQDNINVKLWLYWVNAKCLLKLGRNKQAEHSLTRLLTQQPNNYQALIERGKIRYVLGARELSIRDLRHAIHVSINNQQAYRQLYNIYIEQGDQKSAYTIASMVLQKGIQNIQFLLDIIEILLLNKKKQEQEYKKLRVVINRLKERAGDNAKNNADFLFFQGRLLEFQSKQSQACIYYQECLKFNNSKIGVTRSLEKLVLIKIKQRDYYSAYHTVNRYSILQIQIRYIYPYIIFLQGVILAMKKKYQQSIKLFDIIIEIINGNKILNKSQIILDNILKEFYFQNVNKKQMESYFKIHNCCKNVIIPLVFKFNAYSSFKLGKHQKCIYYYEKLGNWGLDECSSYNMLLAEGVVAVQKKKKFQVGMQKFQQARFVYPCKVEPSIYIAMTVIYRDICLSQTATNGKIQSQTLISAVVHAIEQLNQACQTINDSSSNLLFHRSMLNMFLQNWEAAQNDINKCIDKAEENQPKYFFIRGLSYAVQGDLKRAINQYSICLSLNPEFHKSLLERAKCYFLMGETEIGFADLKQYMLKNQNDYKVHKWIGDLLYEGKSYSDALRAYEQIQGQPIFQVQIMKCKCLVRVGDLHQIAECMNKISLLEQCNKLKIQVDILSINLLKSLVKSHENLKQVSVKIKKLNNLLEDNNIGYIFQLIDCMYLLAIATFDLGRYQEAYQSFLLVLQLNNTLVQKHKCQLKSDCSQQSLSLSNQDIYMHIVYSLLGMKDYESAIKMMSNELMQSVKEQQSRERIKKIIQSYGVDDRMMDRYILQSELKKNERIKLRQVDIKIKNIKIKCSLNFCLFHHSVHDLYSNSVASNLVKDFKPSYIDNMPEGPWIKRDENGVIFTDLVFEDEGSMNFISQKNSKQQSILMEQKNTKKQNEELQNIKKKQNLKNKMKLDEDIENKLNFLIQKNNHYKNSFNTPVSIQQ